MQLIEYINIFYNMIYGNELAMMRGLFQSYEDFLSYKDWLETEGIHFRSLSHINENTYTYTEFIKNPDQIDHVLHISFQEELEEIREIYQKKTHVIIFSDRHHYETDDTNIKIFHVSPKEFEEYFTIEDPSPGLFEALIHCDQFPGAMIFSKDFHRFIPIHNESLEELLLKEEENFHDSYYLHLSDAHLGPVKNMKGLEDFYVSMDTIYPYLKSTHKLKICLTGDIMNSPNRRNMYLANDFMTSLKKKYHGDVTFILGNHDMIVNGFNVGRTQKSKVIAYLLGEKLKILEDDKVILIKVDSASHGNLARGMIGTRQLVEIEDELSTIDHLEEYTLIVLLHHHVYTIDKADFLKRAFKEKLLLGKIIEQSKVLVDSKSFQSWLEKENIHYVLHGHKHVPFFTKRNDTYIVSAGSMTGGLKGQGSRYLSYNVLKYNYEKKCMSLCMIVYVDKKKNKRKRIEIYRF